LYEVVVQLAAVAAKAASDGGETTAVAANGDISVVVLGAAAAPPTEAMPTTEITEVKTEAATVGRIRIISPSLDVRVSST
jgi:hypothetical protein